MAYDSTTWTADSKTQATGAAVSVSTDLDVSGDLTVNGADITIGADADGTDRTIIFGHSTLKSIIGIDDSQDKFAINTDGAFESTNDLEISAAGTVIIGNGDLVIPSGNKLRLDGNSSGDTYLTEHSANTVRLYIGSAGHYISLNTPYAENSNTVYGKDAGSQMHADNVNNTFIGDAIASLGTMTSAATNNTGLGTAALSNITAGYENTAIGVSSCLDLTTGDRNAALGRRSLYDVTDGNYNTSVGWHSGYNITTGSYNVCIGALSQTSAVGTDNEIVIGREATGLGANKAVIGNASCTDVYLSSDQGAAVWLNHINMLERSSDPTEPAEGHAVVWMSDGSGKGDDGDIMIASQAGGATKYATLFDHSGGSSW